MRIVIQRVREASVTINGHQKSAIQKGFLILLGIEEADERVDVDWLVIMAIGLRVLDVEIGVLK